MRRPSLPKRASTASGANAATAPRVGRPRRTSKPARSSSSSTDTGHGATYSADPHVVAVGTERGRDPDAYLRGEPVVAPEVARRAAGGELTAARTFEHDAR